MKIVDKLARIFRFPRQEVRENSDRLLSSDETFLIRNGSEEQLAGFAASPRLHAVDIEGNTPLHLAARFGKISIYKLFTGAGADIHALNHQRQTPAEVAMADGGLLTESVQSSFVARRQHSETERASHAALKQHVSVGRGDVVSDGSVEKADQVERRQGQDDVDDLLYFEAEDEPENFFRQSSGRNASGIFVPLVTSASSGENVGDWELDLTSAPIAGDGVGSGVAANSDQRAEHDFLKVRNSGRKSLKRATVPTGTRLSIHPDVCTTWAEEIVAKGWFCAEDVEELILHCDGNADPEELRKNLRRNLEAAGFDLVDHSAREDLGLWDARSDISANELAEAIEAVLTRATPLPGTQRFDMDKSEEHRLLEPMVRAKRQLHLNILSCERAVKIILNVLDDIRSGSRDPAAVSLRSISSALPDNQEASEVFAAAEAIRFWQANGRVMDGKRRRDAIQALEVLDLSLSFHKELVDSLQRDHACFEDAARLDALITDFEVAKDRLILEHLPYARRFAARNVEEGEDPEDVFQVAFMGLQRSTRRFDPARGSRFIVYCSFWMKQALTRWRADEGALIRVPVHRQEDLAKLDQASERLVAGTSGIVPDSDLAMELGWATEQVELFRRIPREASYVENVVAWDDLFGPAENPEQLENSELRDAVAGLLATLTPREERILRMRFGIGAQSEQTLEEVGQQLSVTRERIRQIEAKALQRLRHPARKHKLRGLLVESF